MTLQLDDATRFSLGGFLFPTVTAEAQAGDLTIHLDEAGAAGEIVQGEFNQRDNVVSVAGPVATSVTDEPINLAEQPAAAIDFPLIQLTADRRRVQLATAIETEVLVPLQVGLLSTEISILIDGAIQALGSVPPADYHGVPVRDKRRFVTAHHSTGFVRKPLVRFPQRLTTWCFIRPPRFQCSSTWKVGKSSKLRRRQVVAPFVFRGGTLNVASGEFALDGFIELAEDARLESELPMQISAANQTSTLRIDGFAGELIVTGGVISGHGEIEALEIGTDATLRKVIEPDSLRVQQQLTLDGEFVVQPGPEAIDEPVTLVEYEQVRLGDALVVSTSAQPYDRVGESLFRLHRQSGLFFSVEFQPDRAVFDLMQAAPGDIDGDGIVGFPDFLVLSENFGDAGTWSDGDFDGDGQVGFADFLILSEDFGTQATVAVPEPALFSEFRCC